MKLERLINYKLIDNLVETVCLKKNELKVLVNETVNCDLAVGNMSKCKEEKIKGENGKDVAVNLTTEVNRTLTDQKTCLDKNSKKSIKFS